MDIFLQGFADELVKVGAISAMGSASSGAPTLKPPAAPKPMQPAGGPVRPKSSFTGAIKTQRMESPAAAPKPQRWRPSPGYKPNTSTDPVVAAPKKQGRRGPKKKPGIGQGRLAFESDSKFKSRTDANLAKNKARAEAKNAPPQVKEQPKRMASFSVKPSEAPIGGRKFDKSVSKQTRAQVTKQDKATPHYVGGAKRAAKVKARKAAVMARRSPGQDQHPMRNAQTTQGSITGKAPSLVNNAALRMQSQKLNTGRRI